MKNQSETRLHEDLKPFFWDVSFDELFTSRSPHFIISRLMEHGNESALRFLMATFTRDELIAALRTSRSISRRSRNFWALLLGIEVKSCTVRRYPTPFIHERIPLQYPLKRLELDSTTINMAHAVDIGRMKLFSIASRGSRKDFIDLYCLTRVVISMEDLLSLAVGGQQGLRFNSLLFLKGLIDFDEADEDLQPVLLWDVTWDGIKKDLLREVKQFAEKLGG
jgi:hypothetical protein